MANQSASALRKLTHFKSAFGPDVVDDKLGCLKVLAKQRLNRAGDVLALHEVLCFMRAYPDDPAVLQLVDEMLDRFERRGDLRRFREQVADTGMAGTVINFPFFAPTADWLSRRWGGHLSIDWSVFENTERLEQLLPILGLYCETPGLDEFPFEAREWIDRMKGRHETDATFLLRRLAQAPMTSAVREMLFDGLDAPFVLKPGSDTPARTREKRTPGEVAYQTGPLRRGRPDVRKELARPPVSVRRLPRGDAQRLIDLARSAMVTRARDLDAFAYADAGDVTLIDCGDGLKLVLNSMIPERRFLLESNLGYLLLKNGVPVGYGTYTTLFNSVEVAYSVFDTFRSGEAGWMYARVLAAAKHMLSADAFTVEPYQLGQDNDDAIASGAWWFYQKLGFRPRAPRLTRIMNRELKRMQERPKHRSSAATLKQLVTENVFLQTGRRRGDIVGLLPLSRIGLKLTDYLAMRFGGNRAVGERVCAKEAATLLGVRSFRGFSPGQRLVWRRWGPLVLCLPDVERWPAADCRALVAVIKAKGGPSEAAYVRRFNEHRRLRRALVKMTESR